MNILLVAGPNISLKEPFNSGIEAFIVTLAHQLIDKGHRVDVIAGTAETDAKFRVIDPFKKSQNIKNGWIRRRCEQREFESVCTQNYDVIHYNMFYPHLLKSVTKMDTPSVLTLHSPVDRKRKSFYKKLHKQSNLTFVAISDRIKQQWDKALNVETLSVQNGINLSSWPLRKRSKGGYLLWSARINEVKNPLAAIKLAQYTNSNLIIAGRIVDRDYFDSNVRPHLNKKIKYVGHKTQQELSAIAQNASTYLATATWQEPFGLAALEMLASGVPVVGYESAVPPNWIHVSVSTVSSNNWRDLIVPLQSSLQVHADDCRSFASTMSIDKMALQYLDIYNQIVINEMFEKEFNGDAVFTESEKNSLSLAYSRFTK